MKVCLTIFNNLLHNSNCVVVSSKSDYAKKKTALQTETLWKGCGRIAVLLCKVIWIIVVSTFFCLFWLFFCLFWAPVTSQQMGTDWQTKEWSKKKKWFSSAKIITKNAKIITKACCITFRWMDISVFPLFLNWTFFEDFKI